METNGGDPREVVQQLKAREPMGLKNPVRVRDPAMTNRIADLKLHPSIECGLHMLNDDIVSAHFVRRAFLLNYTYHSLLTLLASEAVPGSGLD